MWGGGGYARARAAYGPRSGAQHPLADSPYQRGSCESQCPQPPRCPGWERTRRRTPQPSHSARVEVAARTRRGGAPSAAQWAAANDVEVAAPTRRGGAPSKHWGRGKEAQRPPRHREDSARIGRSLAVGILAVASPATSASPIAVFRGLFSVFPGFTFSGGLRCLCLVPCFCFGPGPAGGAREMH